MIGLLATVISVSALILLVCWAKSVYDKLREDQEDDGREWYE